MSALIPRATYLVGTYRRYKQYLADHPYPGADTLPMVFLVEELKDIQDAPLNAHIMFLKDWEQLPEHRQIYNWVIVRQTLERLIKEAAEEESWRSARAAS